MKIQIVKDGPYLVSGNVPIREVFIVKKGRHYVLEDGRPLPQAESYALCRCGHSHNAPFCDGSHAQANFQGKETADRAPYAQRVEDVTVGATMEMTDDGRCAFARFCHTERGDVWTLTEQDEDSQNRAAAIRAAGECHAGRLVMRDKEGNLLEEPLAPEILIAQDPEKGASAGIFVRGPIQIIGEDGEPYEQRNRVALCRCGKSRNKPFCDAMHVRIGYEDGFLQQD